MDEEQTPVEAPEDTPEEVVEPQETEAPDETDKPDEGAEEAPTGEAEKAGDNASTEGADVEEEEFVPEIIETPKANLPDIKQFVDAEGNLDLAAYQQAQQEFMQGWSQELLATATKTSQMQSRYQREWEKAETKFPDLRKDKELRSMVQAIHANSAAPGSTYLSPLKAAEKLFGVRQDAKLQGMRAAKETRTVQAAATLAAPAQGSSSGATNQLKELKAKMSTGTLKERKAASAAYLEALVKSGRV